MNKERIPTMGIHLGSTFSCLALKQDDQILVTKDCLQIPSVVVFTENNHYAGHEALNHQEINPSNTISNFLQLLGRNFDNEIVQKWMRIAPYKIISDDNNRPKVFISSNNKSYYPEEIAAIILRHLTKIAKNLLNQQLTHAVITVPAHFDDQQRHALKNACDLAGISDLRLISSPYASGFAYEVHRGNSASRNFLTFSMGSQSCELTWLNVEDGILEIKANRVSSNVSGEAFTQMLVNHVSNEFQKKLNLNFLQANIKIEKVIQECILAKCQLSQSESCNINLGTVGNQDLKFNINRQKFDQICGPLYQEVVNLIDSFIKEFNIDYIEDTILIGSSTLIPGIQETIKNYFGGRQPLKTIHPQQVRAIGAVQQADQLCHTSEIPLADSTQLSFGIETKEGVMTVVIPRNTEVPISKSLVVTTSSDSQRDMLIKIFEGERYQTKYCFQLGEINLEGISIAPQGVPQIDVKFEIDCHHNILVKVKDLDSHKTSSLRFETKSRADFNNIIKDSEDKIEEDKLIKQQMFDKQQRDQLQKLLNFTVDSSFNSILDDEEKNIVSETLQLLRDGIDIQIIMKSIGPLLYKHELQEELFKEGQYMVQSKIKNQQNK